MKNVKLLVPVALVVLVIASWSASAQAENLKFGWSYDAIEAKQIDGFRLYRDGQVVDTDAILKTALTVTVPRQTDKKDHVYHLVAYAGEAESSPSNTVIDKYSIKIKAIGPFTIEVVK